MQVYKIENKVYCCNYNFKSEMPTLVNTALLNDVSEIVLLMNFNLTLDAAFSYLRFLVSKFG